MTIQHQGGLTLARNIGQRIIITTDDEKEIIIELRSIKPSNRQAHLNIIAPNSYVIDREEIYDAKRNGIPDRKAAMHEHESQGVHGVT